MRAILTVAGIAQAYTRGSVAMPVRRELHLSSRCHAPRRRDLARGLCLGAIPVG
jgi:hypothetical protein